MSRLTRRELLKWGVAGAAAAVLAACAPKGGPSEPGTGEEPAGTSGEPKPAGEAITLRFMTRQGEAGAHMREFAKRYGDESNGRIVVECEEAPWEEVPKKLETQLVTGTMVDATWGDTAWWPYLAKRGAFLVIEPYIEKAGMDLSKWFNTEWFRKWTDGQLSGLGGAAGINHILTFYNKEWVTEAWGKEPSDDWTMDDYVECMQACVELKGEGHFGGNAPVGGNHVCDGWIRNWGKYYINPEGTQAFFSDSKTQDGIKFIREQLANKSYPGREEAEEGETAMFLAGVQATLISNPGASTGMVKGCEEAGIDLGVCLAPKGPSAFETPPRRAFVGYANTFGCYSKTKYPEEAFGLIVRVTSVESMKWLCLTTGKQPGALLDTWYDPEIVERYPWFPKVADLMKDYNDIFPMPANTRYNEYKDVGDNEIPPLVYGEVDYSEANIKAVNDHLQEIIDLPMPGE